MLLFFRASLSVFLFFSMSALAVDKKPISSLEVGTHLKEFWQQPESVRNEVRHVLKNLGVSSVYLTGERMKLFCDIYLSEVKNPNQLPEQHNMTDQKMHPATVAALNLIFSEEAANLQEAVLLLARAAVENDINEKLGRPYSYITRLSAFHIVRQKEEAQGVLRPLFFPLELYKENPHDSISESLFAGVIPAVEDLLFNAIQLANKKLPRITRDDILALDKAKEKKIFLVMNRHTCDGDDCSLLVSLLNKKGKRQDVNISYNKKSVYKHKAIAKDLIEAYHAIISL